MISYIRVILLAGVTFYIASIYGSPALALFSFAEVIFALLSLGGTIVERAGVKCTLKVPISMTQQGQQVKVLLSKEMRGKHWGGKLRVQLMIRNTCFTDKKCIWQTISCDSQNSFHLIMDNAGNYEISIRKMRIYDISGLFYLSRKSKEAASVVVLPELYPVNIRLSEAVRNFAGEAEVYDTVRCGDDASEILKLRAFKEGDKLKNIHWKLSAKAGELMVKESSMPRACSTVLLLDSRNGGKRGNKAQRADAYIRAATSLSFSMMDMECPHYVAWYSRRFQDVVRMRVTDEESFYGLLVYLLQDYDGTDKVFVLERYQEKYRAEILLHRLLLKQNLRIYEKDMLLAQLEAKNLENSLAETELLL